MGPWGGFFLGLAVAVLVNFVTALFSREKALRLIPWLWFYVSLHLLVVFLNSDLMRGKVMQMAHNGRHGWLSYSVVMLVAAGLAGLYWRGINFAVDGLAAATQEKPTDSKSAKDEGDKKNIAEKTDGKHKMPAHVKNPAPPSAPPVQNAPGGINIGRDNTGTAIVNNFVPPPLTMTAEQERGITEDMRAFAGKSAEITVNNGTPEMLEFTDKLKRALNNAGVTATQMGRGGVTVMSTEGVPKSISFELGPEDEEFVRALDRALHLHSIVIHPLTGRIDRQPSMANRCLITISAE